MLRTSMDFIHRHLYYVWGGIVVGTIHLTTGALLIPVVGYLIGLGAVETFHRLLR